MKIADIIASEEKTRRGMPDFNFFCCLVVWRHFSIFSKLPRSNNSSASVRAIKPLKNVTEFSLFYESSCRFTEWESFVKTKSGGGGRWVEVNLLVRVTCRVRF